VCDESNARVQKFSASMIMTYNATAAGGYTAVVTTEAGNSSSSNSLTIYSGNAGTITGGTSACNGATTNLTDAVIGGTWSSSNTAIATVGSTGVVSYISGGTATITYTFTDICGTFIATVNVMAIASVATISGTASVCAGLTTTLSDATSAGVWSSEHPALQP